MLRFICNAICYNTYINFVLFFLAPPVIIGDPLDTKAAHAGEAVVIIFMVYSLSVFNVTLHRLSTCNCNENVDVQYNYAMLPTVVNLPVLGQELLTDGFHCTVSLTVTTKDDFGDYVIVVSNIVGQTTAEMKIVAKGDFPIRLCMCIFWHIT